MEKVEKAYAKLNLTLDIVGESRGFHLLDMLVCTIDIFDTVTVRKRNDGKIVCLMDGVPQGENNSAVKAARHIIETFKTSGFDIFIEKHIPFSGGLGGSTADSVAVVRAVVDLLDLDKKVITPNWLLSLSSDAPNMYQNGLKRVRGIGERIDFIDIKIPYKVAFIAGNGVDTTLAYRLYDTMKLEGGDATERLLSASEKENFDVADFLSNDLYLPACSLNPEVLSAVEKMKIAGARAVNMSGSGSTIYGMFTDEINQFNFTSFIL